MKIIRRKTASSKGEVKSFLQISRKEWLRIGQSYGYWGTDDEPDESLFDQEGFSWERGRGRREEEEEFENDEEFGDASLPTRGDVSAAIQVAKESYTEQMPLTREQVAIILQVSTAPVRIGKPVSSEAYRQIQEDANRVLGQL